MASQKEIFYSEPPEMHEEEETPRSSLSCPAVFSYAFVILFNWDESEKHPFKVFNRNSFSKEQIDEKSMKKKVNNMYRKKKLISMKPQKVSLFGKMEDRKFFCFF